MIFNIFLTLYFLLIAPKILIGRLKGKKHPDILQRLGAKVPDPKGKPVIWIHAVSVGEAKAAGPLFAALKEEHQETFFLITTTTATGRAEALRSMPQADAFRYLPFDFTWVVKKWAERLQPKLFILIEGDIWPNLLAAIQKAGGKTVVVSGKISERSSKRFAMAPRLAKKLFARIDLLLVQNETHFERFKPFVESSRLHIAGNLKLDFEPKPVAVPEWAKNIKHPIVAIASTHAPEEEEILDALAGLDLFLILAPRHPERFNEAAELLAKRKIPFARWSRLPLQSENVLLLDAMGQLPVAYSICKLAIVGGSFTSKVGGHNVLEPSFYGAPVLFGPYMHAQTEFAARVLESGAGAQVSIADLRSKVLELLGPRQESMRASAAALVASGRGSLEKTLGHLRRLANPIS